MFRIFSTFHFYEFSSRGYIFLFVGSLSFLCLPNPTKTLEYLTKSTEENQNLPNLIEPYQAYQTLPILTEPYRTLPSLTEPHQQLPNIIKPYRTLPSLTEPYQNLPNINEYHQLPVPDGLPRVGLVGMGLCLKFLSLH